MNLKINIKRPQITREEIAANKDFGELLKMYKSSAGQLIPFYKTKWFYTSVSIAAAVVIAMFIYIAPVKNRNSEVAEAFFKPPVQNVNVESSLYAVSADEGMTITYKSGSVIKIPAKAFVDKKGNPVSGKVDITYRELNDPIDFFLAGIPMNYDSAGVNYALESAGMVEIHASQKGKEVDLNPEKPLDIVLASHQQGSDFNLYQWDLQKKQWQYSGKELDNTSLNANEESKESLADASSAGKDGDENELIKQSPVVRDADSKLDHIQYEIRESIAGVKHIEAAKPFEPGIESKGHRRFSVNVSNIKDFPELAMYNDIMFKATDENNNFDKKEYNKDWDGATLSKKGDNYILNLHNADETASYIVNPVFEGEGYNMAQNIYKEKLAEYEVNLAQARATEGEKQQELTAVAEVVKSTREAEVKRILQKEEKSPAVNPGNLTFHNFKVGSLGIWGLGTLAELPHGASVSALFTDENGKAITFAANKIFLVEKGRNALFEFASNSPINYDPQKQNTIWGVTADNKIAVFRYEDFKSVNQSSGSYTFRMQVSDAELANESQVEYYLNI